LKSQKACDFILSVNAEVEFLHLLIRTCHAVQSPQNKRRMIQLVSPAAQWEEKFQSRIKEIETEEEKENKKAA
jgi:hypothetical protein